jgi:hypothetical protein
MGDSAKFEIIRIREGNEAGTKLCEIRTSKRIISCKARKVDVLPSSASVHYMCIAGNTSFITTTSPTLYSGFSPPAAFVTVQIS